MRDGGAARERAARAWQAAHSGNGPRDVVGMRKDLFDEPSHVGIVGHVEDPGAVPTGADQARQPQLGQMLGHAGGLRPDQVRQLIDRVLAVEKGPDDAQPCLIAEQFQHAHGRSELVLRGNVPYLAYLRSHVDRVPRFELRASREPENGQRGRIARP